jgi:hypothetical protein
VVVRRGMAGNDFFFPSLSSWICVQAMPKIKIRPSIFLFFRFSPSYLIFNFFYLHWLFLIGFYFLFHTWSFNFWNCFSNLVFIFWIAIYFVLNCFFDWFFFYNFTPDIFFI